MIRSFTDLVVYQRATLLTHEVFQLTKEFPKEEMYSLTDQIRRASRSIPANIAEGWTKRRFENVFKRHLVDASGSCSEVKVWLQTAFDCGYISHELYTTLFSRYDELGKMLYALRQNWRTHDSDL